MSSLEPPSEPPGTWEIKDEMLQYIKRTWPAPGTGNGDYHVDVEGRPE